MELKKSKKADLENKKSLFLEIGLALALLLVIGLFSWSKSEKVIQIMDLQIAPVEQEIVEITTQDEKPPEVVSKPMAVATDIINIVQDDKKITQDFNFTEFDEDATIVIAPPAQKKEEAVVQDEPFIIVEDMPQFDGGGLEKFREWVMKNLQYPSIAAENGIQGKVHVSFVIEKDGSLTNIQVAASPDRSLSEETTRVLQKSPKWTPGKQRGAAVRVRYNMPVDFVLQ